MSPLQRGLVGAAMGSLAVLAIHPGSRPFLLSTFSGWGPGRTLRSSPLIFSNLTTLPQPNSPVAASLWVDAIVAASRNGTATSLDFERALSCVTIMSNRDPDNAFWRQIEAVIRSKIGDEDAAESAWLQASKAARWDNQAGTRNVLVLEEFQRADGVSLAWHGVAVKRLESTAVIQEIEAFARSRLRSKGTIAREDLVFRFATLVNGRLVRDGAKSFTTGLMGYGIVELASYPQDIRIPTTPRKLLLARTGLTSGLQQAGLNAEAEFVSETFKANDGWKALMPLDEADHRFHEFGAWAMLTVSLPGAFFLVALAGASLWGLGELLRRPSLKRLIRPSAAPILGLFVGILVWRATQQGLAAVCVAASMGFLAFTPPGARSVEQTDLGNAFLRANMIIATIFFVPSVLFVFYVNTPSWEVLTSLDPSHVYKVNTSAFAIPAIIAIAFALVSAPAWAYGLRVTTTFALSATLRTMGKQVFVACLTLAIIVTPLAASIDRGLNERLRKIVTNEPMYYYLEQ